MKFLKFVCVGLCALVVAAPALAPGQSVVVNEFYNSGGASGVADAVELLVTQPNLDMRGMLVKDYVTNGTADPGGVYVLTTTQTLWQSVRAGTLIVARKDVTPSTAISVSTDTVVGGSDFNLELSLNDPNYFQYQVGTGTLDLSTNEIVQVKSSGSATAGTVGAIHSLISGTAGTATFGTGSPTPKLVTTTGTGAGTPFCFANNTTSALADYNGTDCAAAATGTIGAANNANNQTYINSLRASGVRDWNLF